jgi:hypothetical protein
MALHDQFLETKRLSKDYHNIKVVDFSEAFICLFKHLNPSTYATRKSLLYLTDNSKNYKHIKMHIYFFYLKKLGRAATLPFPKKNSARGGGCNAGMAEDPDQQGRSPNSNCETK